MKQKEAAPAGPEWVEKNVREFSGSPFERIGKGWMLITAGYVESDRSNWNTMTASWGGLGVLWRKDVAFMFIRPSRFTFGFANSVSLFTLSFFDETYRGALNLCGEKSGRDIDKATATGLTPVFFNGGSIDGAVSFKEASDIIVCKKIYTQDFDPGLFLDAESIEKCYHGKDYHKMYIGEIVGYRTR
jgi:flavin reductase (DIM6/NTAB) family NADH-FMN oxidoreductase RutF